MNSIQLLTAATTAIRDLQAGYRDDDIVAPSGRGVNTLLRDLVTYLRENGVDDEGAWDCAATADIEVRKVPDFEPFTLVVRACAGSEFFKGPEYAEIRVTPKFVEQLVQLSRFREEHEFVTMTIGYEVDRWDLEDEMSIAGGSLGIFEGVFWFNAHPKHAGYNVMTIAIGIANLVSVATLSKKCFGYRRVGDKVFYTDNESTLDDFIALYMAKSKTSVTCDECGTKVEKVIGCPDGKEICQQCFDQGSH